MSDSDDEIESLGKRRPRDDDYDARPRRGRRDEDDEDGYDDRPRRAKSGLSGTAIALIVGLVLLCGGVPVIAILVGLMLPAVQKVRQAASRAQEQNNLKEIGLGMHMVNDATGRGFSAPFAHDPRTGQLYPANSFRVSLLPYLEQDDVYRQFDLTQPWDGPRNRPAADTVVKTFTSPYDAQPGTTTPFRAFVGGGALFNEDGRPVRLGDIADGTSNTLMLGHAAQQVPWAKPQELAYSPAGPVPALGHPAAKDGANVLLADGSVRFLRANTPAQALRALITRAGGEVIDPNW